MKTSLLGLNTVELRGELPNEKPFVATQLFAFLQSGCTFDEMTSVSKTLRAYLNVNYSANPVSILKTFTGKSGTEKYLFRLEDDNLIEGVYMPHDYGDTLCVSTQIGCRMGCKFCASGKDGLLRNLTAAEILGQVVAVNRLKGGNLKTRALTNIVLMGSGEPFDNYDNLMKFLELVTDEKGLNFSERNISVSTSGLSDKVREFALSGHKITLSISLHAPFDDMRSSLMPVNKKWNVASIVSAAKFYFEQTGRRVIYEYTLIKGVNDTDACANELVSLTRGYPSHVNLIPLNAVKDNGGLRAPDRDAANAFLAKLTELGVSATIRRSLGGDVEGACGQLKRRYLSSLMKEGEE